MILRISVIGLLAFNILLWGWASLQPANSNTSGAEEAARILRINGVPSIMLASESNILSPGGIQASRQCFTLGPIESRSAMRQIQDELERSVVQLSWHETTSTIEQGYWVYLQPFGSYDQAAEAVEQLVANGVTDYYVMPAGPFANAVSVGLYDQRSLALARRDEIEALGLGWPISVEMARKDEARYWLDFEIRRDAGVRVDNLVASSGEAQHLEVPCRENEASFPPT
jgi:hypothetical protein